MINDGGVEVRAARADEADEALRVLCASFALNFDAARPIYYRDPFFDLSHKRLLLTPEDGLVSCLTLVPAQLRVGAAWVPLGGIAGMATRPDLQGRGWGGRLLAATLPALAEELHYPISGLFPAFDAFYRRFGWETASGVSHWQGSPGDLPAHAEAQFVRPLPPDAAPERASVRQLWAAVGETGACQRDERRWQIIEAAQPARVWIVYQPPGETVTGYAIFEETADGGGLTVRLLEMRGATPEARRGLLGYLAQRTPPSAPLTWAASEDDLRLFELTGGSVTRGPGMMLRLVDLAAALAAVYAVNLAPILTQTGRSLTVRAEDSLRPENERPVRLTPTGVVLGAEADRDWIAADIRALARLYLGDCRASELHAQGLLRASSPPALDLADLLFPQRHPFVAPLDQF